LSIDDECAYIPHVTGDRIRRGGNQIDAMRSKNRVADVGSGNYDALHGPRSAREPLPGTSILRRNALSRLGLCLLLGAGGLGRAAAQEANLADLLTTTTPGQSAAAPASGASVPFEMPATAPALPKVVIHTPADDPFPRLPSLKPAVAFWTRVFAEYSERQSVIHSTEYPHKVFTVLDFRGQAEGYALDRQRSRAERDAKARAEDLLKRLEAKHGTPASLTAEERRIYDLFADVDDERKFKRLRGTIRAQRGLKERTEQALETSVRYLPEMERIFASYQMPVTLTRLPLVESSFNIDAYSKVGAAGLWQFIPTSARIYMRLNEVVDDRRDPWTSTDAAARHLRDDYATLQDWPLAITAYNHGRSGIAKGLRLTGGSSLPDLIARYRAKSFGFASRNFYAEFLAAVDVERAYRAQLAARAARPQPLEFDVVETKHYVPYETLRRLCGADDTLFRKLNPAYRPEVIEGKLYVPPGHLIRVPAGSAQGFQVGYSKLADHERFDAQRAYFLLHKVKRGEIIARIARKYGVSAKSILAANGMKSGKLRVGQVLRIPPRLEKRPGPVTVALGESTPQQTREQKLAEQIEADAVRIHRVRSGQTLGSIAKRYKVTVDQLRVANDLGNSSHIRVGMKLKIPVSS
jgi:membrane-bound lytic murein transglycosylase D